jgi:hypothetical protein
MSANPLRDWRISNETDGRRTGNRLELLVLVDRTVPLDRSIHP